VTMIIACLAQSSHELVPPDALEPVVRAISDNFIWSNCASEVITAGLNGLREICQRSPLSMPEELLKSLMEDYKNHREKGPMNAARSLLGLYREFNPTMLKKKDRGKSGSVAVKSFKQVKYGEVDVCETVDGAELLGTHEESVDANGDAISGDDDEEDSEWGSDDDDENDTDNCLEEVEEEFQIDSDDIEDISDSQSEADEVKAAPKSKISKLCGATEKVNINI
jgi:protein SDA1